VKQNYHFCYINRKKNYLINKVDCLLKGEPVTMLLAGEKFIIHKFSEPCDLHENNNNDPNYNSNISHPANDFVAKTYPKQKYLSLAIDILNRNNLIDHNLYFIHFPNMHLVDVCAFFNNRFGKHKTTDAKLIKLCKFLKKKQIKFPKVSIKNPVAQTYIC
jgi:hypothetical protein